MMYADYPDVIFGFHGCDKETYLKVIRKSRSLTPSNNSYDWLGSGISRQDPCSALYQKRQMYQRVFCAP